MRCSAFDGFPCLLNGKADAQVICIDPTLAMHDNVTLQTGAYVSSLGTDGSGRRIDAVHVKRNGRDEIHTADIVMVACGALSSALLLLRSANAKNPNGLANGSDQVGRNYMRHEMSIVMAVMRHVNETVFQKTLALSDFYFGSDDWEYPLGLIQMCAKSHPARSRARRFRPGSNGCRRCRSRRWRGTRWISGFSPRIFRIRITGFITKTAGFIWMSQRPIPKRSGKSCGMAEYL